ncbi:MAG: type II toxin-antitoxin system HicB family antitoxin [Actinomycetota bacterium]
MSVDLGVVGGPRSERRDTFDGAMSGHKFTAVFERDEAGYIYAHVPELPEVQTQGHTLDEAREMVRSAIDQAIELRQERGEPIPAEGWAATELVEVG